jgi:hypothetical protein
VFVESVCRALRAYLERHAGQLSEEVRNYPRPISRCDVQLPALLEQRARALHELERLRSLTARDLAHADCIALAGKVIDALADPEA